MVFDYSIWFGISSIVLYLGFTIIFYNESGFVNFTKTYLSGNIFIVAGFAASTTIGVYVFNVIQESNKMKLAEEIKKNNELLLTDFEEKLAKQRKEDQERYEQLLRTIGYDLKEIQQKQAYIEGKLSK